MGLEFSRSPLSTGLLTKVVAQTLILLLISLHPSPWMSHAAAQQAQNPEAARAVEEIGDEVKTPIGDRPPFMRSAGSGALTIPPSRTSDWVDGFNRMRIASVHPRPNSATPAASGQGSQPPNSQSGSTAQKKSSKWKWILIAAAGGAAVGAFALKGNGGSGSDSGSGSGSGSNTPPPTTITAGAPTVGSPQ